MSDQPTIKSYSSEKFEHGQINHPPRDGDLSYIHVDKVENPISVKTHNGASCELTERVTITEQGNGKDNHSVEVRNTASGTTFMASGDDKNHIKDHAILDGFNPEAATVREVPFSGWDPNQRAMATVATFPVLVLSQHASARVVGEVMGNLGIRCDKTNVVLSADDVRSMATANMGKKISDPER